MIIDSDYETLTIKTKEGQVLIRNIDEYNLLKYSDEFDGKQIIRDLPDGVNVTETFNEGIFNVTYKDTSIQLRDKIEIAKRLNYCIKNNTSEPIKELLLKNIENELKSDILEKWLLPFWERVKFVEDGIIIDDSFKVNKDATAYYKDPKGWSFLCIVAGDNGNINKIVKHSLGEIKIDFKTMEIYNKVLFLLYPNIKDDVFYNQLPKINKNMVMETLKKYGIN